ncbi:MAG: hydroxymethylbilane synthase [Candidatus Omnitrophica bacterium]|nr:hydroxymethylbilane synthase [Candidatus Omnitrophota bacterium]
MKGTLRIGTRGSKLALAQAEEVKSALEKEHPGLTCELVILKTTGDDFTAWKEKPAALKGLFVKEIEEALLKEEVELGVHSAKDLEVDLPEGLAIGAVLPRKDPRDAAVLKNEGTFKDLPQGSKVGVSSIRRRAQLLRIRRDLELLPLRGNVDTRLRKLEEGEVDALILAGCGLLRLGLERRISEWFDLAKMLPSPAQGALALEVRAEDAQTVELLKGLEDPNTHAEVNAERAFLKALGGSCQVPIGALARVEDGNLTLTGAVLSPDGLKQVREKISGPTQAAERLGRELASTLRAIGADRLLYGHWTEKTSK